VIAAGETPEDCRSDLDEILATLEITPGDLISKSYFELVSGG